ncbi:EF-Hand 1, calcium-binding site [Phytophthora cactorum]|nr:EF-Hand 1, calcium-binding site [Phytophthora cactorum]
MADAEPDPSATPSAVANARHRALQEQLLHFDQNAWLTKHAKHPVSSSRISVEELEDPMLSIGIVNDTREIEQIVNKLDKDSNGQIDFQEFHNKGSNPQKHEVMFHQLTKKMEHQSSGFLEINTQLSMERRRFILDSITSFTSQSIQEDLEELKHFKEENSSGCHECGNQELVLPRHPATPVGSPGASAKKILQTRRASDPALTSNNNNQEPLPEEAQSLKDLLLSAPSQYQRSRFSFLKLKRSWPPNAINNIVAGSKIPMTKAMWKRHRARMMRRLPGRIDERVAW